MTSPHPILIGERGHGVVRLATALLPEDAHPTRLGALQSPVEAALAARHLPPVEAAPAVHLHVTDALLGDRPVLTLAALTADRRLALTLHDIPQHGEGEARRARRAAVYRELCSLAELVIVCSAHESAGLRDLGVDVSIEVVDHPIDASRQPSGVSPAHDGTVGVLGWVYPGKGHADVLAAMATAVPGGTLFALGGVSPGHESLVGELRRIAPQHGVEFQVTGYLSDADLLARAAAVAIPVCAHRHVSASGTIGTWITAGRAPIVADGPYAREVHARCPGALTLTSNLAVALEQAIMHPESTVLDASTTVRPSTAHAAARQQSILEAWATAS